MQLRHVVALEEVVDVDLPVAGHLVAGAPVELVAGERAAEPPVDAGDQFFERWRRPVERGEHQPLPLRHARQRHAHRGDVEVPRAAHVGRAEQAAVEPIPPAVVAADELRRAAPVTSGQRPGAMAADVVQGAQFAVVAAHDEQRHAGNLGQRVVARLGDLPGVRHELPAAREDGGALGVGERRLRVAGRGQRERGGSRLRRERGGDCGAQGVVHRAWANADAGHCRKDARA
jgi:hypothetical protein